MYCLFIKFFFLYLQSRSFNCLTGDEVDFALFINKFIRFPINQRHFEKLFLWLPASVKGLTTLVRPECRD